MIIMLICDYCGVSRETKNPLDDVCMVCFDNKNSRFEEVRPIDTYSGAPKFPEPTKTTEEVKEDEQEQEDKHDPFDDFYFTVD